MSNRYVVPIGVLVAAILIIAGGYLILNSNQQSSPSSENRNESYIEPSESEGHSFMPEINVTEEELKQNADVPFKVGKKYVYKTRMQNIYEEVECNDDKSQEEYYKRMAKRYEENDTKSNITEPELPAGCERKNGTTTTIVITEYNVEKIEKAEGKDCYVVSVKSKEDIEEIKKNLREHMKDASEKEIEEIAKQEQSTMEQQNTTFYFDKETGKMVKVVTKMGNMEMTFTKDMANVMVNLMGMAASYPVFSQWMLALDENFRWTQTMKMDEGGKKYEAEIKYKVIGSEKINNRECFKVEITFEDKSSVPSGTNNIQTIIWVDKEKRILVKGETKMKGMRILGATNSETNLISES